MENGWMDWIEWMWMWKVESECGKWRGSGSHTSIDREFEFYEFFSFLKFYDFFSVEKNS